jgi:hypothetical protein
MVLIALGEGSKLHDVYYQDAWRSLFGLMSGYRAGLYLSTHICSTDHIRACPNYGRCKKRECYASVRKVGGDGGCVVRALDDMLWRSVTNGANGWSLGDGCKSICLMLILSIYVCTMQFSTTLGNFKPPATYRGARITSPIHHIPSPQLISHLTCHTSLI